MDALHDATRLLRLGFAEWARLESNQRKREGEVRAHDETVARRRARLSVTSAEKAELHEIDALLEILVLTPGAEPTIALLRTRRSALARR